MSISRATGTGWLPPDLIIDQDALERIFRAQNDVAQDFGDFENKVRVASQSQLQTILGPWLGGDKSSSSGDKSSSIRLGQRAVSRLLSSKDLTRIWKPSEKDDMISKSGYLQFLDSHNSLDFLKILHDLTRLNDDIASRARVILNTREADDLRSQMEDSLLAETSIADLTGGIQNTDYRSTIREFCQKHPFYQNASPDQSSIELFAYLDDVSIMCAGLQFLDARQIVAECRKEYDTIKNWLKSRRNSQFVETQGSPLISSQYRATPSNGVQKRKREFDAETSVFGRDSSVDRSVKRPRRTGQSSIDLTELSNKAEQQALESIAVTSGAQKAEEAPINDSASLQRREIPESPLQQPTFNTTHETQDMKSENTVVLPTASTPRSDPPSPVPSIEEQMSNRRINGIVKLASKKLPEKPILARDRASFTSGLAKITEAMLHQDNHTFSAENSSSSEADSDIEEDTNKSDDEESEDIDSDGSITGQETTIIKPITALLAPKSAGAPVDSFEPDSLEADSDSEDEDVQTEQEPTLTSPETSATSEADFGQVEGNEEQMLKDEDLDETKHADIVTQDQSDNEDEDEVLREAVSNNQAQANYQAPASLDGDGVASSVIEGDADEELQSTDHDSEAVESDVDEQENKVEGTNLTNTAQERIEAHSSIESEKQADSQHRRLQQAVVGNLSNVKEITNEATDEADEMEVDKAEEVLKGQSPVARLMSPHINQSNAVAKSNVTAKFVNSSRPIAPPKVAPDLSYERGTRRAIPTFSDHTNNVFDGPTSETDEEVIPSPRKVREPSPTIHKRGSRKKAPPIDKVIVVAKNGNVADESEEDSGSSSSQDSSEESEEEQEMEKDAQAELKRKLALARPLQKELLAPERPAIHDDSSSEPEEPSVTSEAAVSVNGVDDEDDDSDASTVISSASLTFEAQSNDNSSVRMSSQPAADASQDNDRKLNNTPASGELQAQNPSETKTSDGPRKKSPVSKALISGNDSGKSDASDVTERNLTKTDLNSKKSMKVNLPKTTATSSSTKDEIPQAKKARTSTTKLKSSVSQAEHGKKAGEGTERDTANKNSEVDTQATNATSKPTVKKSTPRSTIKKASQVKKQTLVEAAKALAQAHGAEKVEGKQNDNEQLSTLGSISATSPTDGVAKQSSEALPKKKGRPSKAQLAGQTDSAAQSSTVKISGGTSVSNNGNIQSPSESSLLNGAKDQQTVTEHSIKVAPKKIPAPRKTSKPLPAKAGTKSKASASTQEADRDTFMNGVSPNAQEEDTKMQNPKMEVQKLARKKPGPKPVKAAADATPRAQTTSKSRSPTQDSDTTKTSVNQVTGGASVKVKKPAPTARKTEQV